MSNATATLILKPFGAGGRELRAPVKATQQIYGGTMVAQISGACVPGTTAAAGDAVGVALHDALGGASDGTVRIGILTDQVFVFPAGTNAPTDATPLFSDLYMEDDHTVGTGGVLGSGEGRAGKFMGLEDDGSVRVFVGGPEALEKYIAANGAAITDTATQTVNVVTAARVTRFLCAAISQNSTVTLGTTGAVVGDVIRIVRTDASAHTLAVANGGAGTGTLATLVASKVGWLQAYFDGTNWLFDGCSAT